MNYFKIEKETMMLFNGEEITVIIDTYTVAPARREDKSNTRNDLRIQVQTDKHGVKAVRSVESSIVSMPRQFLELMAV